MNKIRRKFLGIFLSLSILTSLSLTTRAKTKQDTFAYTVEFNYKGKDLEKDQKDQNVNPYTLGNHPFKRLKNKTTAKELVNIYAVMSKIFEKYKLPKDKTMKNYLDKLEIITTPPVRENLKLTGDAKVYINESEEKFFHNLFKNFNNDLKNITITKKDFKKTQNDLINKIKKDISTLENKLKNYEAYDIKNNKSKNLIEIGRILPKKILKQGEKSKKELLNKKKLEIQDKKELKWLKELISEHKEILKNDKKAEEEGERVCKTIKNYKYVLIPNMKKHIKQIENVKYDDVEKLTKDLKVNLNKLGKHKLIVPFVFDVLWFEDE